MKKKVKPHYLGHRERLRRRFQKTGAEGMQEYELLELLLTYAVPRKDVKPVAKNLIKRFGDLASVLDADLKELENTPGVGSISAILIKLVKELFCVYLERKMSHKDLLSSPKAVIDFARAKLAGYPHEVFMVIYLNAKNEVIEHKIIHEGTINRAIIYPRRVIEEALKCHATSLILVHNHPSGHPEPSEDDKNVMQIIKKVATPMDIDIVDHIIVAKNGYFSFAEQQLI